jgi:hypothetical protein
MADRLKLYLFSDQTYNIQPQLQELLQHRDNLILEAFLKKTYNVVRMKIYKTSSRHQGRSPLIHFH